MGDFMSNRIIMKTPLVEMDGDEMTRVLWQVVKDRLILPFVDLKTEYYDLGVKHRDDTKDQVTYDSAQATIKYGVAVKCATITTTPDRMKEYDLKHLLPSPNGIIRGVLDGTVFRKPIFAKNIKPSIPAWVKPIHIGRHAYGDIYKNSELQVSGPGLAEFVFTAKDGVVTRKTIIDMPSAGVICGIHNLDASIKSFARACFLTPCRSMWTAGLAQKTPFPRFIMAGLGISLTKFSMKNSRTSLRKLDLFTSIH